MQGQLILPQYGPIDEYFIFHCTCRCLEWKAATPGGVAGQVRPRREQKRSVANEEAHRPPPGTRPPGTESNSLSMPLKAPFAEI